jgi:hypothetical protein
MRDGAPQVDPVWVDLEGDEILVSTRESHLKAKNTHRDTRVGLSVIAMDNPYQEAQMRGRVIQRRRLSNLRRGPDRQNASRQRLLLDN